jgi:hypothetical protein
MRTTEHNRTTPPSCFTAITEGERHHKNTIPKKWFFAGLGLVVLMAAANFSQRPPSADRNPATPGPGVHPRVMLTRLAGAGQGFGPVVEATLPAASIDGETELLDLETGCSMIRPGLERFNDNAAAMTSWVRAKALNISGRVWPDGTAACITYNMTALPVETRCWGQAAGSDIPGIPVPEPGQHSPSRLLVVRPGCPETYVFRTDEGTLGMLRLVGLSEDQRAVKIRYKLLRARAEEVAQHIGTP